MWTTRYKKNGVEVLEKISRNAFQLNRKPIDDCVRVEKPIFCQKNRICVWKTIYLKNVSRKELFLRVHLNKQPQKGSFRSQETVYGILFYGDFLQCWM